MRRFLLAAASLMVAFSLAELALRLRYPLPPSLVAMDGALPARVAGRAGRDLGLCRDWTSVQPSLLARGARPGAPELWVSGDSVAMGWGVGSARSFGGLLADGVRAAGIENLRYSNDGTAGGSLCTLLSRARHVASARPPTWAVLAVFADDLQDHGAMYVNGRLVAWPETRFSPAVASLFRSSWVLNLAWYASVVRDPAALDASIPPEEHDLVVAALADTQGLLVSRGVRPLWILLPPSGRERCLTVPPPPLESRCGQLEAGLGTLRGLYARAGVPILDLADVFTGRGEVWVSFEGRSSAPDQVAIHPNEAGHALIAEAAWPSLQALLR